MFEIYKKGYNTLPNLKKLKEDEVFERNRNDSALIRIEKEEALKNQNYFMEFNNDPKFYEICEEWILKNYPIKLKSTKYLDIAKETDEDFLIHRVDSELDYLCSAHVCFASHWRVEDKIGKSFNEIHAPVPMNLKNSSKLVHTMIHGGIFERFVWSVVHENKYNFHPRFNNLKFDIKKPKVLIKVERQVTVGFSKYNFCLFILRQYLISEDQVDKKILSEVIQKMTLEQKKYKGLEDCENLIVYLNS